MRFFAVCVSSPSRNRTRGGLGGVQMIIHSRRSKQVVSSNPLLLPTSCMVVCTAVSATAIPLSLDGPCLLPPTTDHLSPPTYCLPVCCQQLLCMKTRAGSVLLFFHAAAHPPELKEIKTSEWYILRPVNKVKVKRDSAITITGTADSIYVFKIEKKTAENERKRERGETKYVAPMDVVSFCTDSANRYDCGAR